jgi:E3 UFM1-protein ligase 1
VQLIYTSDGKEYLTNEQLEREIRDTLSEQGGRINILELPQHIGVNIEIIERAMDTFVKRNRVTLINNHLISAQYIDQLMEEINEMLVADSGQLMIQDLTTKYQLPLEFLKDSIASRLDT